MRLACLTLLLALLHVPAAGQVAARDIDKGDAGAEFTLYLTDSDAPTVIVCPGGSYCWLGMQNEGTDVCRWLNDNGVSAVLLKYRTAGFGAWLLHYRYLFRGHRHPDMICDVQRAVRYLRMNATALDIDPDRIGVMGFSAGGHLALSSAVLSDTDFTGMEHDGIDVSLRPDFVAAVYPVVTMQEPYAHRRSRRALLGERDMNDAVMRDSLSIEGHVRPDCPPVFLVNCKDDPTVDWHNSELLADAFDRVGVEYRYMCFDTGGHGFGVRADADAEYPAWKTAFISWLNGLKLR